MGVETHSEESGEGRTGQDGPLTQEPGRDGSSVAAVKLQGNENDQDEAEAEQATPDFRVAPRIHCATPLEGEKQANNAAD